MTYAELLPILFEKNHANTITPPPVPNELPLKKRKMKRLPMRSLTCWGIIAVKATNKNHEHGPEDGNRLQRLARGATILFARISCFSTHFNRGNPPSFPQVYNTKVVLLVEVEVPTIGVLPKSKLD
ncbi:hypothetical protein MTR_0114s0100 [Medicago truncatula]|uniref:Uncharacterized protein n=1 Tax=Medicago truncatula TaxID=3880 RepID=A0A072TT12_MEDTR|nr:hypothetical protein MTR_0114s0100 [Medicago truncatula]